ncbi:hypothetical protein [Cytobacillus praedii]|uniref:hypothetical protein n=1 Tax=Cytobacillus praedii TaxID=1742358 RepID=UPI002E21AC2A|nr:hypothetical protein [Cytobacillus praedii]
MKAQTRLENEKEVLHLRGEDPNSIGNRKKGSFIEWMKARIRSETGKKVLHRMDESPNSIGNRKKGPSSKE